MILENFYRQLIIEKREELDLKHENYQLTKMDFEEEQNTFAQIAEHHGEKLRQLREIFDSFNFSIDSRFDETMKKLRQWSGYGEGESAGNHDLESL